ncbi:mannose-6-phosphate isomerase, class I [Vibrio renipiscarius]|uniref:Mannose-6-phosphate isomerase n=1 Tax=Vibrio renipiscarius TaxID=1461322 RepID=A0A0C2N9X4_9VIBR|nr:mannose-6-phosphate isomerase, class I [Vibrio renipiscarius]KII76466.1 mannose-6-phosphate isomerase [Vibrio renipiscarius]KII78012.1 mannose-6-phosphate isomerase [Vibrio renipiscarius]
MTKALLKLDNVIQNYIWGSKTAIGELFGIANPTDQPQAEIWMGAHPNGCSRVAETGMLLSDLIAQDPHGVLGGYTVERFGELPYLFKVLSAEKPLSVQVHPCKAKAIEGFARENAQGIELGAGNRNYKDPNHKPELVYALTFYKAMNGFRPVADIVSLFNQAGVETLRTEIDALHANPSSEALSAFFTVVMNLSGERKQQAIAELLATVNRAAKTARAREAFELIKEFSQEYADDIGLFSPLLLNVIELEPGEAMFLHAETPHAYVKGTGLEIMANSDNVLRAGLTPKYMDVAELIDNTLFHSIAPDDIKLAPYQSDNKLSYPIPVDDFGFDIMAASAQSKSQYVRGAEIVMCIDGDVVLQSGDEEVRLIAGESAFICHHAKVYHYQGEGTLARAFN